MTPTVLKDKFYGKLQRISDNRLKITPEEENILRESIGKRHSQLKNNKIALGELCEKLLREEYQPFKEIKTKLKDGKSYGENNLNLLAFAIDYKDFYNGFRKNTDLINSQSESDITLKSDNPDILINRESKFLNPSSLHVSVPATSIFLTGRDAKLTELREKISLSKIVIIHGIRGIGKTTFVHKYVAGHISDYSHVVYAAVKNGLTMEAVLEAFKECGNALGFNPIQEEDDKTKLDQLFLQLVQVLNKTNFQKPLLIIDNANGRPSLEYFLKSWKKHNLDWTVLITSFCNDIKGYDELELLSLEENDAINIYEKYCSKPLDIKMLEIFKAVDFHPLLCELISKIYETNQRINLLKVKSISDFTCRKAEQPEVVNPVMGQRFASNQEITIVEYITGLFTDIVSNLSQRDKDLLRYMSIIPSAKYAENHLQIILPLDDNDLELLDRLKASGWLLGTDTGSYYMHELYQMAIQNLLKPDSQNCEPLIQHMELKLRINQLDDMEKTALDVSDYLPVAQQIVKNLHIENPELAPVDPFIKETMLKMLDPSHRYKTEQPKPNDSLALAELLRNMATICNELSNKEDAFTYAAESFTMKLRLFKENNFEIAKSLAKLAGQLAEVGRSDISLEFKLLAKEISDKDPETTEIFKLRLMRTIANAYRNNDNLDKAIEILTENIQLFRENEVFRFDLALSLTNLGFAFGTIGRKGMAYNKDDIESRENCRKSIKLRLESLKLRTEIHKDKEHIKISTLHNDLGAVYSRLGEYDNALEHYKICKSIREKKLPPNHLSLSIIKNNLATCYAKKSRLDSISFDEKSNLIENALILCKQGIEAKSKIYGEMTHNQGPNFNTMALILLEKYRLNHLDTDALKESRKFALLSIEVRKKRNPPKLHEIKECEVLLSEIENEIIAYLYNLDKQFWQFRQSFDLSADIMPTNLAVEKERFLASFSEGEAYNPGFTYAENSNSNLLDQLASFSTKFSEFDHWPLSGFYLAKIENIADHIRHFASRSENNFPGWLTNNFAPPEADELKKAFDILNNFQGNTLAEKETIEASEAKSILAEALFYRGITDWNVEIVDMVAKMSVNSLNKSLRINKLSKFSSRQINRLIVHEIETHIYRGLNGSNQPFGIFAYGFTDYLDTEEGLAIYNEERSGCLSEDDMNRYALRMILAEKCRESGFYALFSFCLPYVDHNTDTAFTMVTRLKRGLTDTSRGGGYLKDLVYFRGYLKVKGLSTESIQKLYTGKIGIQHLHLAEFTGNVPPEKLPGFYF